MFGLPHIVMRPKQSISVHVESFSCFCIFTRKLCSTLTCCIVQLQNIVLWICLYIFCLYIWLYLTDCIDFFKMLIFGFLTPTMFEQPKKISVKAKNFLHLNSTFNPQDHHQIKASCLLVSQLVLSILKTTFNKYFQLRCERCIYPLFHSMGIQSLIIFAPSNHRLSA